MFVSTHRSSPGRSVCYYLSSLHYFPPHLPVPPFVGLCHKQTVSFNDVLSLSLSLAHTLTHGTLSPSRTQFRSLGCNQTMLRGDHGSRGGTLPHRPSKKPDPVLPTDSVCGLFDVLPREIRDEIYDLISQPKEETHQRYHFKTLTRVPHARLINKRFTKEYDERPALNTHLEVTQCFRPDSDCLRLPRLQGLIPSSPAQTRFLHFYLLGCIDPPWRGPHTRWSECLAGFTTEVIKNDFQRCWGRLIHDLVSVMPVLEEISISISCGNMRCARGVMLSHDIWKGIPHLCRVALLSPIFDFRSRPHRVGPMVWIQKQ
jgi:hypothetical protein